MFIEETITVQPSSRGAAYFLLIFYLSSISCKSFFKKLLDYLTIVADTYSQIYLHVIFAVKGRQNLISAKWKDEVFKYITGIVKNEGQKLVAINGMPDHLHLLVGLKPQKALSDLVRDVKANSSPIHQRKRLDPREI